MPTIGSDFSQNAEEADTLKALQKAAQIGFADLDEGRSRDITDDDLDALIGDLGRQAGEHLHRVGR
jgi:antitoxin ParD1/3/4